MTARSFEITSPLRASAERAWAWAVSAEGISAELWPVARMTMPPGAATILDIDVELGRPLFRSWVLLFGVLPIDRSDLTLIEIEPGHRFLEESPMLSMRLWRHERIVEREQGGSRLTDRLTFEPRFAAPLVAWFVSTLFRHRHAVLQRELG